MNRVIPLLLLLVCVNAVFAQEETTAVLEAGAVNQLPAADAMQEEMQEEMAEKSASKTAEQSEAEINGIASLPAYGGGTTAAPTEPPASMPELFSAGYLFQVLGSLFVVFICLFAVIYMLRRFNRMGPSSGTALRIIGSANVGQRERVVLLEAGNEQVLLGVAPGSVRPLHVLAEPLSLEEGATQATDFAAILRAANPLGGKS